MADTVPTVRIRTLKPLARMQAVVNGTPIPLDGPAGSFFEVSATTAQYLIGRKLAEAASEPVLQS